MTTALKSILDRDNDELAARRFADQMLHLLRDFIPDNSRQDAWDLMVRAAYENKFELTTFAMRKQYEAWQSTQLDGLKLPSANT